MFKQILDTIKEYNRIMVHGHIRPDGDCYGSQFGLAEIIKENFPEKEILADLKIMDGGKYEAGQAFKAGADYITVLGVTDNLTVKACVEAANEYGKEVVVDMICVEDIPARVSFSRFRFENNGIPFSPPCPAWYVSIYLDSSSAVGFIRGMTRVLFPLPVSFSVYGFCFRKSHTHRSAISCTRAALSYIILNRARSRSPSLVEASTASRTAFIPSTERYSKVCSGSFFLGIDCICWHW